MTTVTNLGPNIIRIKDVGVQGAAGVGVPTGGTTGQVLAKIDGTNYNTQWVTGGGGGGVTDHGALTGLSDDDHSQYHNDARGDLRYEPINANIQSHISSNSNPHSVTKTQVGLSNVVNADTTTTANITDSTNKRFITDAQQTVLGNTSGTNSGDQTNVTGYAEALKSATTTVVVSASAAPTSGQVLTANSGTAASWQSPTSGVTDHTLLSNIGTNTHAQIDSHIGSTSNPHSVTKSQVGLGSVVNADTTTTANITDSSNKRFVTDTQLTIISNTSGTNTGDQDLSSYAVDANVVHKTGTESIAGAKTFTDDISLVKASGTARSIISAANATDPKILSFRTANVQRWAFRVDGSGDDIFMRRYDNAGTFIDAPISADRTTGTVTINGATMASKQDTLGFTPVTNARTISTTAPLTGGGDLTANRTLSMPVATAIADGYLAQSDWTTFNNKQASLGFTPEDVVNKSTNVVTDQASNTKYPSVKAVYDWAVGAFQTALGFTPANKAGDTFTGAVIPSVVTLSDAATIAVNAALGNQFTVTLSGNRTLGNPTGAVSGQLMLFAIRQDGTGSRTLAYDTKFRFGTDITAITLTTAASKTDYIGVRYHSADDKFDIISVVKGY